MNSLITNLVPSKPDAPAYLDHALTPAQNANIVAIHFFAMYLEISIYVDGALVFPYFASTIIAWLGAFLNRSAIKKLHIYYLTSIIFMLGASSVVPFFNGNIVFSEFMLSYIQIIVSIISSYCIFIILILSSRERLVKLLSATLIFIIIGSFLERFSAIRALSDSFRSQLYPADLLYSSDYRDIQSYGTIRPRFLTREPSIVGIGAGLLISMIFLLSRMRLSWKIFGALGTSLICIAIMRSPTIIFFAVIVCYGVIALRTTKGARLSWMLAFAATLIIVGASSLLAYGDSIAGISNRSIWGGGSYILRVFGPPLIWLETLKSDALFGLGLGSFDALLPLARKAYGQYDILALFPYFKSEINGSFLISNGFWEYWIFFGLLGGSLIIFFLYRLFRIFGLRYASFPFYASVLSLQTYGGISAYRPWHMIFVFAAIAFWAQRLDTNSDVAQ